MITAFSAAQRHGWALLWIPRLTKSPEGSGRHALPGSGRGCRSWSSSGSLRGLRASGPGAAARRPRVQGLVEGSSLADEVDLAFRGHAAQRVCGGSGSGTGPEASPGPVSRRVYCGGLSPVA